MALWQNDDIAVSGVEYRDVLCLSDEQCGTSVYRQAVV